MSSTTIELTEEQFYEQYEPIPAEDGSDYWEMDAIKESRHEADRIWSVVDGDNDSVWVLSGVHFVNVFAHMVTKNPHQHQDITACLDGGSPMCVCGDTERYHESFPEDYDHDFQLDEEQN